MVSSIFLASAQGGVGTVEIQYYMIDIDLHYLVYMYINRL